MKDQFATPDRRVKYTGPQNRRNAPGFKTPVGSFDGERVNYTDRRRSSSPVDRRSNRAYKMGDPQRRITRNSYGRRDGDPQRAKAAGQFVPRSYLKAAVTQAIRDFVPGKPVRVADRRTLGTMTRLNNQMRRESQRRTGLRDRRQVLMADRPVRRNGYGRRAGDTVSYMTLPAGGRYDQRNLDLAFATAAMQSPSGKAIERLIERFEPTAKKDAPLTLVKRYDSAAARDDSRLAKELADTIFVLSTSPMNEGVSRSNLRAALLAVTRRIEEREKSA